MNRASREPGIQIVGSRLNRRQLLEGVLGASGLLMLAGCAPVVPPGGTTGAQPAVPAKSEAPPAAPAAAAKTDAASKAAAPASKTVETAHVAAAVSVNYVPLFVGIEKGVFLKHGLDLQLKLLATAPEATKALGAGEAQFAVSPFSVTPAYEQGVTFVNVATVQGDAATARVDTPFSIFAHKDAGVGDGEIAKLKGKKMGLVAGTTPEQYLLAVLAKHGLKADDLTMVNVPLASQRTAMAGKQVDAIVTIEPYGAQLSKLPESVQVIRGGGFINYSILLSPSTKFFAEQPNLVERAVYGLAEAAQLARQNRADAAAIATRWLDGLDVEIASAAIEHMRYDPRISKNIIAGWVEGMDGLVEQKKLKAPIPTDKLFNTAAIDKAVKEQAAWFSDLKPIG